MLENADITIYNRAYDADDDRDVYCRTVIRGVHWFGRQVRSVADGGLVTANSYTVRIPDPADTDGKTYVDRVAWAALPADRRAEHWTLNEADRVVRGVSDIEAGEGGVRFSELSEVFAESFSVTGWGDNRTGGIPHWRVEGK